VQSMLELTGAQHEPAALVLRGCVMMIRAFRTIALSTTTMIGLTAAAQADWSQISNGSTSHGSVWIDEDKIETDGVIRKAWEMLDYSKPQTDAGNLAPQQYLSIITLIQVNCSAGIATVIQGRRYSGNAGEGDVVSSFDFHASKTDFKRDLPASVLDAEQRAICK